MQHKAAPDYWKYYHALPIEIRQQADNSYKLLKINPQHPSLQFKKIGDIWSVRVNQSYRALATEEISEKGERILNWFWIGTHGTYDKKI